jgi:hypothetical protein
MRSLSRWVSLFYVAAIAGWTPTGCSADRDTKGDQSPATFSVGGSVTGVTDEIVLQNNGGDDLTLSADGPFMFPTELPDGAAYAVTVASPPSGRTCDVTSGAGVIAASDVTDIVVLCQEVSPQEFTLGGSVVGLHGDVVLLNAGEELDVASDGPFSFLNGLQAGTSYDVRIAEQPSDQQCYIANGAGVIEATDVSDLEVHCDDVALEVLTISPADGETAVPVTSPVTLTFSRAVDASTLSAQSSHSPCDSAATVQVSADGFVTCFGGTLDTGANPVVVFTPHGPLEALRTYRVKVSESVAAPDGEQLAADFSPHRGFSVAAPPCTAKVDPVKLASDTGADCATSDRTKLVDNGDGTVTDLTNGLLWTRCSLRQDGLPKNGIDFQCDPLVSGDAMSWEGALAACESLETAGRSDWTLPDIARLQSIVYDTQLLGVPRVKATYFPNTATGPYWSSSNDALVTRSASFGVDFSTGSAASMLRNATAYVRCVATGVRGPPVLRDLSVTVATGALQLHAPRYESRGYPTALGTAYLGLSGVLSISGTSVVGALDTVDLLGLGHTFSGLDASKTYRLIVVAENSAGYDAKDATASPGGIAPALRPLALEAVDGTSATLAEPAFATAGNPAPSVQAYIGVQGTITVAGTTVSGSLQGPIDVASASHRFAGLEPFTEYEIVVVAQNTEGSSVQQLPVDKRWRLVTVTPAFPPAVGDYAQVAAAGGALYYALVDQNYNVVVRRFDGTTWETLGGGGFLADKSLQGRAGYLSLAVSSAGTPYVVYGAYLTEGVTVMRFDGQSWVTVGSTEFTWGTPGAFTIDGASPVVAVWQPGPSIVSTVYRYDAASGWVSLGTVPNMEEGVFSAGGNGLYAAYRDMAHGRKASVSRYNGGGWALVGSAAFSDDCVYNLSLASEPSPWIAYDVGCVAGSGLTVRRLQGPNWLLVGTHEPQQQQPSLQVLDSTPYVAYVDNTRDGRVSIKTYDGGWKDVSYPGISKGTAKNLRLLSDGGRLIVSFYDGGDNDLLRFMDYQP